MPHQDSPTIAIAGAGLMGRLLAWRLLRLGYQVTVFDAGSLDKPLAAAHTAAAMISPMSEVVASERAIYDMGLRSLELWPQWLEALNADNPVPVQYHAPGSIVVAHGHDLGELHQFYRELNYHLGRDNNARWLDNGELQTLEPDLAGSFDTGLYLPDEAHLDNRRLLSRLLELIEAGGGHCFAHSPVDCPHDSRWREYDLWLDCRGVDGKTAGQSLRGVRGEVLWVATDEVHLRHPVRLMHPRYKLYIVPKPDNRFIIGATEIESEDRSPMSVQSVLELCSALYTLNPAFAEARICELDANLRPAYLDNMPRITTEYRTDDRGNRRPVISVNGLYRHGYLLAPKLVEDVLAAVDALSDSQPDGEILP